jgi:phosphoribosylamine--glycine ligase
MRLQSDLVPALLATRDGILNRVDLRWYDAASICVVMAAKGYPDDPRRGTEIRGLDAAGSDPEVKIFHAGTKQDGDRILADGGRVLGVTATGADLVAARGRAYRTVDKINWPGGFCRRDIGRRGSR